MLTATPWYFLPQFRPARLQDCVLWLESDSFNGGIWRNLAPNYSYTNHGTTFGGVGLSSWHPHFPPAPVFYGVGERVDCGTDQSLRPQTLTWELWFKRNSPTDDDYDELLRNSYYKNRIIIDNTNGYLYFELVDIDDGAHWCVSYVTPEDYVLYHVAGTYDGAYQKIYVNGEFRNSIYVGKEILYKSGPLTVGYGALSRAFNGIIPLVRIYKAALTPAEVVHNYTHHPLYYLQRGIDPYEVIAAATAAAPSI